MPLIAAFWDAETWMYPALLPLWSELAHSCLQYRSNHLAGAQAKAKSYDPPYQVPCVLCERERQRGPTTRHFDTLHA
jgi:hypothetical protein